VSAVGAEDRGHGCGDAVILSALLSVHHDQELPAALRLVGHVLAVGAEDETAVPKVVVLLAFFSVDNDEPLVAACCLIRDARAVGAEDGIIGAVVLLAFPSIDDDELLGPALSPVRDALAVRANGETGRLDPVMLLAFVFVVRRAIAPLAQPRRSFVCCPD
jgi:hypothetical protein